MENKGDENCKKNKNNQLMKNELFFREITELSSDIIIIIDKQGIIKYGSPSMERITGYKPEEVIGKSALSYIHQDDLEKAVAEYGDALLKKNVYSPQNPFRIIHKDGSARYFDGTGKILPENQDIEGVVMNVHDVTNHKLTEDSLRESEAKYRLLAEHTKEQIWLMDLNLKVIYVSPSVEKVSGYTPDEIMKTSLDKLLTEESLKKIMEIYSTEVPKALKEPPHPSFTYHLESDFRCKDGRIFPFEATLSFIQNESGIPLYILGESRDISEQRHSEEKLRREKLLFQTVTEQSSDAIILANRDEIIIYANPSMENILGYKIEDKIGRPGFDLIHPDDLTIAKEAINTLFNDVNAPLQKGEIRLRHKEGSWRICEVTASNLVNNHVIELVIITLHDITKRKQAEELLRQSEEKYRSIMENMQEGYWEADLKGNYTFFNDVICNQLGYSRKELMDVNSLNFSDEETSKSLSHLCKNIYKTGVPARNLNWQIIRKDGTRRDIEGSLFLLKDSSGKPKGFRGIAHDITERKKTELSLRQSEEKYRLLADHMKDYVWLMDLNLKITYVSPSAEKIMGYTQDEFKELPVDKLLTTASFKAAMDFFSIEMSKALSATPNYVLNRTLELEYLCKNGQTIWGEASFAFIRDRNGKPVSVLGESRNITERKKMENALRESKENFRRSLDESPLGVRISTIEGKTLYANKAILDIYGYDNIEELISTPLQERYTQESFAEFQQRKEKRLKGESGPSEYEISIVRKDGEIRHLNVLRKEIFWNGEKHSQVIYQDITLRRQAENKLIEILENLRQSIKTTIQVLGTASEAKDPYMSGHQKRVADLARAIATEMKLSHDKIESIRMASAIHDIGKISVPSEILCKPAILSDLEFSLVKGHSQYGYDIIKDVESPWPLAEIVHQHHERLNGSGYPLGLKGANILIESRILAVADVVEAMVSYRPYRPALGIEIALAEIENNAGELYDPKVVEACVNLFRKKGYQMA